MLACTDYAPGGHRVTNLCWEMKGLVKLFSINVSFVCRKQKNGCCVLVSIAMHCGSDTHASLQFSRESAGWKTPPRFPVAGIIAHSSSHSEISRKRQTKVQAWE